MNIYLERTPLAAASRNSRTKFLGRKLFRKIIKVCRKTASVSLCFCKVAGLESVTLLKQDFFKGVFSEIFQKSSE